MLGSTTAANIQANHAALLEQPTGKCEYVREARQVLQLLAASPTELTVCLNGTDGCDILLIVASSTPCKANNLVEILDLTRFVPVGSGPSDHGQGECRVHIDATVQGREPALPSHALANVS